MFQRPYGQVALGARRRADMHNVRMLGQQHWLDIRIAMGNFVQLTKRVDFCFIHIDSGY